MIRVSSEEAKAERNGLVVVGFLSPRTRVTSVSGLLPIAIYGSSTAGIYVDVYDPYCHQGHRDAQGVGHYPWPLWYP